MSSAKPLPFDPVEHPREGLQPRVEHHFDGAGDVIDATVHVDGDRLRVSTDHCGDVSPSTPTSTSKFGDPWKWRCPEGHAGWVTYPTSETGRYCCRTCQQYGHGHGIFDELVPADEF